MCVNQRPVYLQRLLQLRHGGGAFSRFDRAVTDKVLVVGVLVQGERELVLERVDALRCLPLQLSGGAVRAIARASTRVKALYLCRDNIARFFTGYAESDGRILGDLHHARAVGHGAAAGFFHHDVGGPRTSDRRRGGELDAAWARAGQRA